MNAPTAPVPDWKLERFILGELPAREQARLQDALRHDPALQARHQALLDEDEAFRQRSPASRAVPALEMRALSQRARGFAPVPTAPSQVMPRRRLLAPVAGCAITACLAWLLLPFFEEADTTVSAARLETREAPHQLRAKGLQPFLNVFRQRAPLEPERLQPNAAVRSGDQIQIRYASAGQAYGFIFSTDGAGTLTPHLVSDTGTSVPLRHDAEIALDFSYELDDAPGFERFFFITRQEPFDVRLVLDAVRRLEDAERAPLALPQGWQQSSFLLKKVTP